MNNCQRTTRGKKHCAESAKFERYNIYKRRSGLIDLSSEVRNDFLPPSVGFHKKLKL